MLKNIKESHSKRKLEKNIKDTENTAELLKAEQEQIAAERAAIEAEKSRLLSLDEKELMVELIYAVRGFYAQVENLEYGQMQIEKSLSDVNGRLSSLESELNNLKMDNN